jgi:Tol biopolymer transport system component
MNGSVIHRSSASMALVLALLVVLAAPTLVACGGSNQTSTSQPTATPSASPSGSAAIVQAGTIVFAKGTPEKYDTYSIATDGTGVKRLTKGAAAEPSGWSPDGKQILYMSGGQTWIMKANGSDKRRLTSGDRGAIWPTFSPDAKRIAFCNTFHVSTNDGLPPAHVWVMDADGGNPRQVTRGNGNDFFPAWGPDGRIYFLHKGPLRTWSSLDGDVYSVRPDGKDLKRVTRLEHIVGFGLSPDGKTLAVHDTEQYSILLVPVDGSSAPKKVVGEEVRIERMCPAWSPDGTALALAHQCLIADYTGVTKDSEVYVVNTDGSGLATVPNAQGGYSVVWRPD